MDIDTQRIELAQPVIPLPLSDTKKKTSNFTGRGTSIVSVSGTELGNLDNSVDMGVKSGTSEKAISVSVSNPSDGVIAKTAESIVQVSTGNKLALSPFVINPEDAPFTSGITLDMLTMPPELARLTIRTKPNGSPDNPTTEPFRTFPRKPFDLAGTIPERFDQVASWDAEKNDPTRIIAGGVGQNSYSALCKFIFEDGDKMTESDILQSSYYLALNRPTISASCASIEVKNPGRTFWYGFGYIYQVPPKNIFAASHKDAYVPMLSMQESKHPDMPEAQLFKYAYATPNPLSKAERDEIYDQVREELDCQYGKGCIPYFGVYNKATDRINEKLRERKTFGPIYEGCCTREEIGEYSYLNEIAFYPDVVHEGNRSQVKIIGIFFGHGLYNFMPTREYPDVEKWLSIMQQIAKKLHLPILDLRVSREKTDVES